MEMSVIWSAMLVIAVVLGARSDVSYTNGRSLVDVHPIVESAAAGKKIFAIYHYSPANILYCQTP